MPPRVGPERDLQDKVWAVQHRAREAGRELHKAGLLFAENGHQLDGDPRTPGEYAMDHIAEYVVLELRKQGVTAVDGSTLTYGDVRHLLLAPW